MDKRLILKAGKEKAVLKRHPWIFSGAIEQFPDIEPGEILPIYSHSGSFLAQGYFHPQNSLAGRILSFTQEPILGLLSRKIDEAIALRASLFDLSQTDSFRLINAEGDGIPGLIVDQYGPILVIQINTCGIERLRHDVISLLISKLKPQAIYEKSISSARAQEGLADSQGFVFGSASDEQIILENGIRFLISLENGQKTGFFLDQREMRSLVRQYARGRAVLNCFSYSGGFSLAALCGGAAKAWSVDVSKGAVMLAERNAALNGFTPSQHEGIAADVFTFLREVSVPADFIILDPPAFAKKRGDIHAACSGYKEINRLALKQLPSRSYLLTSSCSHFIDEALFKNVVFQASVEAGRDVMILSSHLQSPDHPISLAHPEGGYLKSLLLYIL